MSITANEFAHEMVKSHGMEHTAAVDLITATAVRIGIPDTEYTMREIREIADAINAAAEAPANRVNGKTAAEWRELAAASRRRSVESFERCDTDGFMTQWASDITAREYEAQADLADAGGRHEFTAIFDLEGNFVPATECKTRYGYTWRIGNGDDVVWFNESKAQDPDRRRAANAKKGYYVGRVSAPAYVIIAGGGKGFSGAASCYVALRPQDPELKEHTIVDNGR